MEDASAKPQKLHKNTIQQIQQILDSIIERKKRDKLGHVWPDP